MRWLLYAGLAGTLSGCYVYSPAGTAAPKPGEEIRAELVNPTDVRSGDIVVRDVFSIEGTLLEATADTLTVIPEWLHSRGGRYFAQGEVQPFLREDLESIKIRKFNAPRTALASALAIGLGASLFAFTADLGGASGGEPNPGDKQGQLVGPLGTNGVVVIPYIP